MIHNSINDIYVFNKEAGLLEAGYDDFRECAYPIEEALEGFPSTNLLLLAKQLGIEECDPKHISRMIMIYAATNDDTAYTTAPNISDVDRFDKHLDAIVFAFGSLFKLGLTPNQVLNGLSAVMEHNMTKLNMPKDAVGKLTKPEGFEGPESKLQKILDERNN